MIILMLPPTKLQEQQYCQFCLRNNKYVIFKKRRTTAVT